MSTVDQNAGRQLDGLELYKTFQDKCSGKDTKRPHLERCLISLDKGDTLHVHSIDRLARNLFDLQKIVTNLRTLGATRFDLKYGAGGLAHEALMTNIELYGREVIPRVRELMEE